MRNSVRHWRSHLKAAVSVLLLTSVGCGGGATNRAEVHGTVTRDGKPLEQGTITFVPSDQSSGPIAGAAIQDGIYAIRTEQGPTVGTNRVEIRTARVTGRRLPINNEPEVVEDLPDKYNNKSVLTVEIKQGTNTADFDLKTRK